jgi:hypothetical protein
MSKMCIKGSLTLRGRVGERVILIRGRDGDSVKT